MNYNCSNKENNNIIKENADKNKQQKSDPQITELKGFIDPNEMLEPTADKNKKDNKTR